MNGGQFSGWGHGALSSAGDPLFLSGTLTAVCRFYALAVAPVSLAAGCDTFASEARLARVCLHTRHDHSMLALSPGPPGLHIFAHRSEGARECHSEE